MLLDFFGSIEGTVKRMKGFLVMDNLKDAEEMVVLTFWEIRQEMDEFYKPDNKALSDFMKSTQSMLEQPPQRSDYEVVEFKI
jgi:heme-degrading monooxygenase HmoA